STEYHVAVDRQLDRMLLDRPELLLVSDGSKLRIRSDAYPGRYVEVNAPKPLAYGALVGLVPFIGEPPLPAVVPLLSSDPIAQLAGGPASVHYLAPDPANPADRPGLRFDTAAGVMTLLLDPASH